MFLGGVLAIENDMAPRFTFRAQGTSDASADANERRYTGVLMGRACVPFTQNRGSPLFEGSPGLLGPKATLALWGPGGEQGCSFVQRTWPIRPRKGRGSVSSGRLAPAYWRRNLFRTPGSRP